MHPTFIFLTKTTSDMGIYTITGYTDIVNGWLFVIWVNGKLYNLREGKGRMYGKKQSRIMSNQVKLFRY